MLVRLAIGAPNVHFLHNRTLCLTVEGSFFGYDRANAATYKPLLRIPKTCA